MQYNRTSCLENLYFYQYKFSFADISSRFHIRLSFSYNYTIIISVHNEPRINITNSKWISNTTCEYKKETDKILLPVKSSLDSNTSLPRDAFWKCLLGRNFAPVKTASLPARPYEENYLQSYGTKRVKPQVAKSESLAKIPNCLQEPVASAFDKVNGRRKISPLKAKRHVRN